MNMENEFELKLGETEKVIKSIFGLSVSVVFCGAASDNRYSIALIGSRGHNSFGYNLYFSKSDREIRLPKGRLKVSYVSNKSMRFTYHKD